MAKPNLSEGALAAIFAAGVENPKEAWKNPTLQVLLVKKIEAVGNAPERYRIVLSDGLHFTQGMIGTQINHIMAEGRIDKGSIVTLSDYSTGKVKEKTVLIVLAIDLQDQYGQPEKMGDPKQVTPDSAAELAASKRASSTSNFYGKPGSSAGKPGPGPAPAAGRQSRPSGTRPGITISPIEGLSPYQNKWTIKARVTNKSDIRKWHNSKSEGKLFSVTLMDESGEIKATGFNDQCDTLYDMFQEGNVYYVSKCKVQIAKKQFSTVDNDYELTFERDTEIEKCEDTDDVPQQKYNFVALEQLQSVDKDAIVDVIGVIKEVQDLTSITSQKTQKSFAKREISIVDKSGYNVRLTVWGKSAENFEVAPESVVAFKGVKVSDFGGRSLSLLASGTMSVDPDLEEAHTLRGWFDGSGRDANFASHQGLTGTGTTGSGRKTDFKTIQQVADENLGMSDQGDWYALKATISYIKMDNLSYPACKTDGCNKKVIEDQTAGTWRCEKCNADWPKPEYRYIMTISANDHTGQTWLNVFDESGRTIIGMSASDLQDLRDIGDESVEQTFKNACYQTYNFRIKAKMDTYNDQTRVRNQVMSCTPIDYAADSRRLIELIGQYGVDLKQ